MGIILQFGLPSSLASDNGTAFMAKMSQHVAEILGLHWKIHCVYRLQSSGQLERANRTVKETLSSGQKLVSGGLTCSLLFFLGSGAPHTKTS